MKFTSAGFRRPELEMISTLLDGCFFSGGAIPGGSFLCLTGNAEKHSGSACVGPAGKIVRGTRGTGANNDTLTEDVDFPSADCII